MKVLKSYRHMPLALEQTLRESFHRFEFRKHQHVHEPDSICDYIYFVEKGVLRYYYNPGDKYEVVRFKKQNDFIYCLKSASSDDTSRLGIEALENCVLWGLPGSLVPIIQEKYIEFWRHHQAILAKELIQLETYRLYSKGIPDSFRFDYLRQEAPDLINRVPVRYLARYTQIPEKVFRHLQRSKIKLHMISSWRHKR